MDAGEKHNLYAEIRDLQFKVKTLIEDMYQLQKRINQLENKNIKPNKSKITKMEEQSFNDRSMNGDIPDFLDV